MRVRVPKIISESDHSTRWLMTFSDVLMLLITFFVFMISMTSLDSKRLLTTFGHFQGAFGILGTGKPPGLTIEARKPVVLQPVRRKSDSKTANHPENEKISVSQLRRRVEQTAENLAPKVAALLKRLRLVSNKGLHQLDMLLLKEIGEKQPIRLVSDSYEQTLRIHSGLVFKPGSTQLRLDVTTWRKSLQSILDGVSVVSVGVSVAEHGHAVDLHSPWALAGARAVALTRALGLNNDVSATVNVASEQHDVWVCVTIDSVTRETVSTNQKPHDRRGK